MIPPGAPAPRTDLLLPFHGVLAQPLGRAGYYVLERRDADREVCQRGVIGALSLHGIETGHVLRHQRVGESDVRIHTRLLQERGGSVEPLLLAAPDLGSFQDCIDATVRRPPDLTLEIPEGGLQHLWACDPSWSADPPALPPVLLADGHHRLEAARRLHRAHPGAVADRLLALVVDHSRHPLTLASNHRVIPRLEIFRAVRTASRFARVEERLPGGTPAVPRPGTFLLTGGGRTWAVSAISPATIAGRLRSLPSEWVELSAAISDHVLIPLLCEDQGIETAPHYTSQRPEPQEVGLILPPPTWDQIWSGAASGRVMPPKSTCLGPAPLPGRIAGRAQFAGPRASPPARTAVSRWMITRAWCRSGATYPRRRCRAARCGRGRSRCRAPPEGSPRPPRRGPRPPPASRHARRRRRR